MVSFSPFSLLKMFWKRPLGFIFTALFSDSASALERVFLAFLPTSRGRGTGKTMSWAARKSRVTSLCGFSLRMAVPTHSELVFTSFWWGDRGSGRIDLPGMIAGEAVIEEVLAESKRGET